MKSLLATITLTVVFAGAAFAGPGDQRSFPYGPVPTFTAQTGQPQEGAPYALTGNTNTTSDALRLTTVWIGGNRDMRSMATFQNAR